MPQMVASYHQKSLLCRRSGKGIVPPDMLAHPMGQLQNRLGAMGLGPKHHMDQGVANRTGEEPFRLLYSRAGYGQILELL